MKTAVDFKQSSRRKISVDSKQDAAVQQLLLNSVGHQAFTNSNSHRSTQYFTGVFPLHYNPVNNPDIAPARYYRNTNPEENQASQYPGQKQGFIYPNISCTQEVHGHHTQCPTMLSTLSRNEIQNSLYAYPAVHSHQLQVLPPIIMTAAQPVALLSHSIPTSHHCSFQPIWTNETPEQNVQFPRPAVPNVSERIYRPPKDIQKKFSLAPAIPEQIFTLPVLQVENFASNNNQDQNTATCNLEQPKRLNKFEEFAKRSHYSKKNLLEIEIPDDLPPKSLFPSYTTPPGGTVLKPLQLAPNQLPTPSNFAYFESPFASVPGIIPHEPNNSMLLSTQSTSYNYSSHSSRVINQAMPQSATENSIIFQSSSRECNPIQSSIQTQFMAPGIAQHQPARQNQITGTLHQYPDTSIYQHETQHHSVMQNLIAAPQLFQNPNPPLYQFGTLVSLQT